MSRESGAYGSMEYRDDPFQSPIRSSRSASGTNFYALCDEISSNLFKINNGATSLEQGIKQLCSSKDSTQLRDKIHSTQQLTNKIISRTSTILYQLNECVHKSSSKQEKLQLERLRNEFRDTVQRYSALQKKVVETIKLSAIYSPEPKNVPVSEDEYGDERSSLLADDEKRREQLQEQQQDIEFNRELLIEREQRVRQLEADILDVNDIFKNLGNMVYEQRQIIDTIEANVETAHSDVETGNEQLLQASKYQKSSRKKICILVIILVIIGAIIAIIVATQVK